MAAEVIQYDPTTIATRTGQPDWRRDMLGFLAEYKGLTFDAYKHDLAVFVEWLERHQLDPYTVQRPQMAIYLRSLEERGYAQATVARRFGTVHIFFEWLVDEERILRNPCRRVKPDRIDRAKQRRTNLTHLEVVALIAAAEQDSDTSLLLIGFMAMLGMRVAEATGVLIENITGPIGRQTIHVRSKGNKLLEHPVVVELMDPLAAVIGDRTTGPLLLNAWGRPMSTSNARRTLARLVKAAGIKSEITPHGLRRAMVTNARAMGVPLEDLQRSLGHSDMKTTATYDQAKNTLHKHAGHNLAAATFGAIHGH